MTGRSAWRSNDVVAYDAMREAATTLLSLLVGAPANATHRDSISADMEAVRDDVLNVQAYDRAAVSSLSARIHNRIVELAEKQQ